MCLKNRQKKAYLISWSQREGRLEYLWTSGNLTSKIHLVFTAKPLSCLISRYYFIKASGLNLNGSGHKSRRVYFLYNNLYHVGAVESWIAHSETHCHLVFTAKPLSCLISRYYYFIKASGLNLDGSGHNSSRVYVLYNKPYIMLGQWNRGLHILKPTAILFLLQSHCCAKPLNCLPHSSLDIMAVKSKRKIPSLYYVSLATPESSL